MILNLRIKQISPAGADWLSHYLSTVEARDPESVISLFRDNAIVQINDGVPVQSHTAVRGLFQRYFANFEHVEHEVLNAYGSETELVAETLCHYTLASSGKRITLPGVTIYERDDDGLIISMRIYMGFVGMFEAFDAAAATVPA
ncbi:MAG: nuclear transport factor 2 family protein [Hyphomonadaceae bacterium]